MGSVNFTKLYSKSVGVVSDDFDEEDGEYPNGIRNNQNNEIDYVAILKVSDHSAGDVDGVVEHSHDKINWVTVATFSTLSADGVDHQEISKFLLPYVRAKMTKTEAAKATVAVGLFYRRSS